MALSTKVGSFIQPTATNASFAVTGVGFKPKALILFATDQTTTGTGTDIAYHQGMATSTTNRAAASDTQLTATNTSYRYHNDTKCFVVMPTSGTLAVAADLVSFDADGFTLNFSTVDSTARIIGYMALGGTDLTNAFIKEFLPANSTGNQSFTGVGFKPDAIFLISGAVSTAPPSGDANDCNIFYGFATSSSSQKASLANPRSGTTSAQQSELILKNSGGSTFTMRGSLVSMDSDGFTINFTDIGSMKYCYALCLKGGQYAIGAFNQNTSTGNQSVTGLGFQPSGVILSSINATTTASILTTQSRISLGMASSSTARASIWNGGGNAGTQDNNTDTGKVLNMITEGASPTTNTAADFVSMDSGGFTINNTTADATSREIIYFAFGSNAPTTAVKMQAMRGWSFPV